MNNLLILGTGRSGTSLTAGLLRQAGYYQGDNYITPRRANVRGFFEDRVVNCANNELIRRLVGISVTRKFFDSRQPHAHQDRRALWLAAPQMLHSRPIPPEIANKLQERVNHIPFCYKDPRFSVTLPIWRRYLPENTRFLVVFRDYAMTTQSILREAAEGYDPPLNISKDWALIYWKRTYQRLMKWSAAEQDRWLFVSFDSIINGSALSAIEHFTGAEVDRSFVDPSVSRHSRSNGKLGVSDCDQSMRQLCHRESADFRRWKSIRV